MQKHNFTLYLANKDVIELRGVKQFEITVHGGKYIEIAYKLDVKKDWDMFGKVVRITE